MRRSKTNRVSRTRAGNTWTEAGFWSYLRSGLRQLSKRWPPRRLCLLAARRPYVGPNKRAKWQHQCETCGEWFLEKDVQVDHREPCGSLKSFDDLPGFCERLFCEGEGMRVLCLACHKNRETKS